MSQTLYGVYCNLDMTEGRGPVVLKHVFSRKKDADAVADQLEPYGHHNQFNHVEPVEVYDDIKDFSKQLNDKIRLGALAKLTSQEREILGV